MNGDAELDEIIARIRKVPQLGRIAAPEVADAVDAQLRSTIGAGESSDGKPWAPRKADGGRALVHASDAVKVGAIGSVVWMRVTGIEAAHHRGAVKGKVARPIIPTAATGIPAGMIAPVTNALTEVFKREVGGNG